MKNPKSLAYINMFAILKNLENLCEIDPKAKEIATRTTPISLSFNVTDGPAATFTFGDGKCVCTEGATGQIKLKCKSVQMFNEVIDGKASPKPYGGFTKIKFALNEFGVLTDTLSSYLQATDEALKDRKFFEDSTKMMFYLVAYAIAAIGNYDDIGKVTAGKLPNGSISMGIEGGPYAEIVVKDGKMETFARQAQNPRAYMIFKDYDLARGLFEGTVDAMSGIATGDIVMKGYIPMIDNLNKLLGRVEIYLG
ncbi:MAG: hypothetical protein RR495_04950 [Anaerovoracaceae bacterium]